MKEHTSCKNAAWYSCWLPKFERCQTNVSYLLFWTDWSYLIILAVGNKHFYIDFVRLLGPISSNFFFNNVWSFDLIILVRSSLILWNCFHFFFFLFILLQKRFCKVKWMLHPIECWPILFSVLWEYTQKRLNISCMTVTRYYQNSKNLLSPPLKGMHIQKPCIRLLQYQKDLSWMLLIWTYLRMMAGKI